MPSFAPDLSVFDKLKSFQDYNDLDAAHQIQRQAFLQDQLLKQAQIGELNRKSQEVDVDKIGEQAIYKAAQGMQLSSAETAAAKYVNAKSGGIQFDPVTGSIIQKPPLLEKMGLNVAPINIRAAPVGDVMGMPPSAPPSAPAMGANPGTPANDAIQALTGQNIDGSDAVAGAPPAKPPAQGSAQDEMDNNFRSQYAAMAGNPKGQQELMNAYAKAKVLPNEEQAKSGGYADRMAQSDAILSKSKKVGADANQALRASVPLVNNYLVSDEYQSFDQSKRDFVNALLRRESGAAISPAEFVSAEKQYFPRPGDSDQVIAQKDANRKIAMRSVQRSAGPSYKASEIIPPAKAGFKFLRFK